MSKLFIFGIGGTGSRVIKSLTMLLAAGADISSTEIVPILIDPDRSNGDLNRTIDALTQYQRIREKLDFVDNKFFKTKITTLQNLNNTKPENKSSTRIGEEFRFEIEGIQNERFKDFIDFGSLDTANKAMASLLFSENNLDSDLQIGFKGNPNIGSVVLNQFAKSDEFRQFASNFEENDRIFIVSSIFGGTGAAGFPLLLKNIRNASDSVPRHAFLRNARIGAITFLPYFSIASAENNIIDSNTFIAKTKAALGYYARNITGNKSLNAIYYWGEPYAKDCEHHAGSTEQRNDAHFSEVAAACAIIDFASIGNENLENINGKATTLYAKEFGTKADADPLQFNDLGDKTQAQIKKPLTQYMYFVLYLHQQFKNAINKQPWSNKGKITIDNNFTSQSFFSDALKSFNKHFLDWITELNRNKRGFAPFNLAIDRNNIYELINGINAQRTINPFVMKNYELFDDKLNKAEKQIGDLPVEQKFFSMFYTAIEQLIKEKFNM